MRDRRYYPRARFAGVLLNKYIDGYPYAVEMLDLSERGMRIRQIREPNTRSQYFSLEVELPATTDHAEGRRIWLWARQVWSRNGEQALRFVGLEDDERTALAMVVGGGEA